MVQDRGQGAGAPSAQLPEGDDEKLTTERLLEMLVRLNADDRGVAQLGEWMADLSDMLGGAFIAISELRGDPPTLSRQLTSPIVPALAEIWGKHCPQELPWWGCLVERPGEFVEVARYVPAAAVRDTSIQRAFCDALGLDAGSVISGYQPPQARARQAIQAAMWTVIGRRAFRPDEIEFCRRLHPHLFLAMKRRGDYHYLRNRFAFADEAVTNSPTGLALLAEDCRVVWMNDVAQNTFRERNGVALENGQLVGLCAADTTAIRRHVAAWRERVGEAEIESGLLPISRSGGMPLGLYFRPSPPVVAASTDAVTLCAFLDPETMHVPSRKLIQKLFGLTEAESRLAVAIASGESPKRLAERTGRSLETVRTQLKFLFRKLGVRRQVDLVRILTKENLSRRLYPEARESD